MSRSTARARQRLAQLFHQAHDVDAARRRARRHPVLYIMAAASYGQAGEIDKATRAIAQLTDLVPGVSAVDLAIRPLAGTILVA